MENPLIFPFLDLRNRTDKGIGMFVLFGSYCCDVIVVRLYIGIAYDQAIHILYVNQFFAFPGGDPVHFNLSDGCFGKSGQVDEFIAVFNGNVFKWDNFIRRGWPIDRAYRQPVC